MGYFYLFQILRLIYLSKNVFSQNRLGLLNLAGLKFSRQLYFKSLNMLAYKNDYLFKQFKKNLNIFISSAFCKIIVSNSFYLFLLKFIILNNINQLH
jgi:hypothetical protein